MNSQLHLKRMQAEITLPAHIRLVILAHIMIDEGHRHDKAAQQSRLTASGAARTSMSTPWETAVPYCILYKQQYDKDNSNNQLHFIVDLHAIINNYYGLPRA